MIKKYLFLSVALLFSNTVFSQAIDPLPSWNEGKPKQAIIHFVKEVTKKNGKHYVPPAERIATFDNDGTLWVEYPMYTQGMFAIDRVKELSSKHPEWQTKQPFKDLLAGDMQAVIDSGTKGIAEIVMATHAGMTVSEFEETAAKWLRTNKHPKFKLSYIETIYQPQLELLQYLRDNKFKTFIVSGGGIGFIRAISEQVYGIPPEQVVGTVVATEFQINNGKAELMRLPKISFIDDKVNKPVGIYEHIGRRPIFAFGNSDADTQMIEYTKGGDGLRLGLFVHHTDAEREYAYDRKSHVGTLDKVLDVADKKDWIVVDMKKDWKLVFPSDMK